jgi:hypothetical protein
MSARFAWTLLILAYMASGLALAGVADAFDVRCHGRHLEGPMIVAVLIFPGLTPVALILATFFPYPPICETEALP